MESEQQQRAKGRHKDKKPAAIATAYSLASLMRDGFFFPHPPFPPISNQKQKKDKHTPAL
jgi:hypothetical protein